MREHKRFNSFKTTRRTNIKLDTTNHCLEGIRDIIMMLYSTIILLNFAFLDREKRSFAKAKGSPQLTKNFIVWRFKLSSQSTLDCTICLFKIRQQIFLAKACTILELLAGLGITKKSATFLFRLLFCTCRLSPNTVRSPALYPSDRQATI